MDLKILPVHLIILILMKIGHFLLLSNYLQ